MNKLLNSLKPSNYTLKVFSWVLTALFFAPAIALAQSGDAGGQITGMINEYATIISLVLAIVFFFKLYDKGAQIFSGDGGVKAGIEILFFFVLAIAWETILKWFVSF